MKILILEDIIFRQEIISKKMSSDDHIDCATDAETALELLKKINYDLIFLDHDLAGVKSGSDLTEFWFKNKEEIATKNPMVIIHSMNIAGAAKMENYLIGPAKTIRRLPFKFIVKNMVNLQEVVSEMSKL